MSLCSCAHKSNSCVCARANEDFFGYGLVCSSARARAQICAVFGRAVRAGVGVRLCEDEQVVVSGDGLLPPRDRVAQARYCAPNGCGRGAAWQKSWRRGPFRAAPVARPALPEALSQHRCRSGGPCRATQIVKHRKHRLVTRLLLSGDWTPSLAQARKMSAPKCNPIASKLVTESQTRRNNKPKRHGWWGTAGSREWMNHALASWLPYCAAIRTSSRREAMRTQRLPYTLRKPTDSRRELVRG